MLFLMIGLVMLLPNSFNTMTVSSFGSMLMPAVFFLLLGAFSLALGGVIMGKLLKAGSRLSAAAALSAMFGYPGTYIIVNDVCESFDVPQKEREALHQMIIAGVVTPSVF